MNVPPRELQQKVPVRLAGCRLLLTTSEVSAFTCLKRSVRGNVLTFCGVPRLDAEEEARRFTPAAGEFGGSFEITYITSSVNES